MSQYGASRFGWNAPSRIAGTTMMLQESGAPLPGELMYQPLVPFYPTTVTSSGVINGWTGQPAGCTVESGRRIWETYPAYVTLIMWQGDDVIVTMYFRDGNDPTLDMSDDNGFTWWGEIRTCRSYESDLIAQLPCTATFIPIDLPNGITQASTKVEMFFPRQSNLYCGRFDWDIRSTADTDLSRFPQPPTVEIWPPISLLKTWLFGPCYIVARTSETDYLLDEIEEELPAPGGYSMVPFVGPNGRVP